MQGQQGLSQGFARQSSQNSQISQQGGFQGGVQQQSGNNFGQAGGLNRPALDPIVNPNHVHQTQQGAQHALMQRLYSDSQMLQQQQDTNQGQGGATKKKTTYKAQTGRDFCTEQTSGVFNDNKQP
jgi:hypothetical protein